MTDKTIELDEHRGKAAQKQTRLRRLHAEVREQRDALRTRQDALEEQLVAAPAESWEDAAEKARYLLNLFAASIDAQDPRRQKLIAAVLDDFGRPQANLPIRPKERRDADRWSACLDVARQRILGPLIEVANLFHPEARSFDQQVRAR